MSVYKFIESKQHHHKESINTDLKIKIKLHDNSYYLIKHLNVGFPTFVSPMKGILGEWP